MSFYRELIDTNIKLTLLGVLIMLVLSFTIKMIYYFIKKDHKNNMEDYIIVDWPEIQDLMEEKDFEDNATLINLNYNMGIYEDTYLVNKEWYKQVSILSDSKKIK